jgi:ribonucleoside-diphosphate reductase alpha chain
MDSPDILLNENIQSEMAKYAVQVNEAWAKKIGINQAARITLVKPEGTNSLALGSSSGIHPHHAHKYFRRVQCNKDDHVYQFFKKHNPHMCERRNKSELDEVATFPLSISPSAITKDHLTAIQFLEIIKKTQQNWVLQGTTSANKKPVTHAVSCTVEVRPEEWDAVADYVFENREFFAGVSFYPYYEEEPGKQTPLERVTTEEGKKKFEELKNKYKTVDYKELSEEYDETTLQATLACATGGCELKFNS